MMLVYPFLDKILEVMDKKQSVVLSNFRFRSLMVFCSSGIFLGVPDQAMKIVIAIVSILNYQSQGLMMMMMILILIISMILKKEKL